MEKSSKKTNLDFTEINMDSRKMINLSATASGELASPFGMKERCLA